jgi:integrase
MENVMTDLSKTSGASPPASRDARPRKNDHQLAHEIGEAVAAYDVADASRKEKAITAGLLLVEARRRHPSQKAFEKFLATVPNGFGIRRAETLIAFAVGRKDFEKHQLENVAANQRLRDKAKLEKEKRLALPKPEPAPIPIPIPASRDAKKLKPDELSKEAFREFAEACRTYLPLMNNADLKRARGYIATGSWLVSKRKAA